MNERIRKLKHQASVWCDENIPDQYSEETNGYGSAWADKFAELIIQECKQAIKHEQDYLFDDGQYELSSHFSYLKERIDEHFGVEE